MAHRTGSATPSGRSKVTVGFGLVAVPMAIKPLNETVRPVLGKTLCPVHGATLNQRSICCEGQEQQHTLTSGESVTGYPHPDNPDQYVVVDKSVLDEISETRTGRVEIEATVPVETIDPAYVDRVYLCWPQAGGEQAFDLLAAALRETGTAAVATAVLTRQAAQLVLRWSDELGCLLAHTCRYETQLRWSDVNLVLAAAAERTAPNPEQVEMAKTLLGSLVGEFDSTEVQDTYTPLLQDAIRAAASGTTFQTTGRQTSAPEVDFLKALRASIEARSKARATKKAPGPISAHRNAANGDGRKKVAK